MALTTQLREIAGKAAGTYFIVTDNSAVSDIEVTSNLRLLFISSEKGPVNTIVIFQQGDTAGFQSIFGKGSRKQEKRGNQSIKGALSMLTAGPVAVMNIRAFSDEDKLGIVGLSPNITPQEAMKTQYTKVFNTNGLWTAKAKNLVDILTTENLLNIANVGTNDVSFFAVVSKNYQTMTNEGEESLLNMSLEIDDFEGLDKNILLKDTFIDVYIFNNTFDPATVTTNKYYGQLFEPTGEIKYSAITDLAAIPESGFNRRITGSLIPNLKSEFDQDISLDVLMNAVFPQTGLISYIDAMNLETLTDSSIINTEIENYYDPTGALKGAATKLTMLSHNFVDMTIPTEKVVDMDNIKDSDLVNKNGEFLLQVTGTIFPVGQEKGSEVLAIFEQGIVIGDKLLFTDAVDTKTKTVEVLSMEIVSSANPTKPVTLPALTNPTLTIPAPTTTTDIVLNWTAPVGATSYEVWRKKVGDANYSAPIVLGNVLTYTDSNFLPSTGYVYVIKAIKEGYVSSFTPAKKITSIAVNGDVSTIGAAVASVPDNVPALPTTIPGVKTYSIVKLKLNDKLNALSYTRQKSLRDSGYLKVISTGLESYKPRTSQFIDGSAAKQREILDMIVSPGIVKGLKNFDGIRYLIDGFKSFVEPGYKYQFGQLCLTLDKGNKFVRAITNDPFIEDLEKSIDPLFRQFPGSGFDLSYLEFGGNKEYTTRFLTKPTIGSEMMYFFGSGNVVGNDTQVIAPTVSNAFINKVNPFDICANATGYLTGITAIEINPDQDEVGYFEKFRSNPIIKNNRGFTIYGNTTAQKAKSALQQIHNSELLAYIKESLYNLSRDEAFKKGVYNEYLATEIEVQSFFDNLVQVGAIQPNPIVICNLTNNTLELQKQRIKLIHIEYTNINALDKIVFDLNLA